MGVFNAKGDGCIHSSSATRIFDSLASLIAHSSVARLTVQGWSREAVPPP